MLGEVVGPGKPLVAQSAGIRTDARVRPTMASQLIRPGEPPAAVGPRAGERLLAGVATEVGLQVRTLAVGLAARRVRAVVK